MPYSPVRSDEDPDGSFSPNQIIEPLAGRLDSNAEQGEEESMWVPFFLRPTTLLAFSASLMTIGLSLGILAWYSGQHQGICAAGDRQYYAWTYGPTAVFTLFGVFWNQIDYRTRLLMPWITMAKGPQPAERSVLLDHISSNIAAAWLHSFKARDFPVLLSITGAILMRVLVVLSAGLFTLGTTQEQSSSMSLHGGLSFSVDHFNASQVNGQAISRVYAANSLNLGYPLYTNASIGSEVPPFQNESDSAIENIAIVDIIEPHLDCEFGTLETVNHVVTQDISSLIMVDNDERLLHLLPWVAKSQRVFNISVRLSSPSCSTITATGDKNAPLWTIFSDGSRVDCSGDDHRFVVGFINSYDDRAGDTSNYPTSPDDSEPGKSYPWLRDVSAFLVCRPDYAIRQAELSFNPSATSSGDPFTIHLLDSSGSRKLGNITGWDIFEGFKKSFTFLNFFEALNATSPQDNATRFLDQQLLLHTFSKLCRATMVQMSNSYLLQDSGKEFEVAEVQLIDRIQLQGPAFWVTEAIILIIVFICLCLVRVFRKEYVVCDPGAIAGIATLLASSGIFTKLLNLHGNSNLKAIRAILAPFSFETKWKALEGYNSSHTLSILPLRRHFTSKSGDQAVHARKPNFINWYYPFIMWISVRMILLTSTIALIASLEAMYRVSYSEDGLLTITDKPYLDYGLRYIPVTTMLLFGLAIGVLDFEIKTFEPFHTLRRGPVPAKLSINENYFGRVGFHALWTALRKRKWCTAATSVGMVLSPFLTIFASGLYYTDTAFDTQTLSLRQSDYFKFTSFTELHEINTQSNGVMAANLVLNDHMDLPDWTYATFAIPTLQHNVDPLPVRSDSFVRVTIPVVRPVANCTIVTPEAIWMQVFGGGAIHMLEMEVSTLSTCGDQQKWYDIHRQEVELTIHDGSFGQWVDRSGLDYHCPEYMAVVGELDNAANTTNLTQVNVLHCTPYFERVYATVSLTYPDLRTLRTTGDINMTSFDTATAVIPVLNESVRQTLAPVEILYLGNEILTQYATEDEMASLGNVDGFFGTLVRNGASLSDFVSDSAALQRAVEDLYVRIVTQVMSIHRDTAPPSNATTESADLGRLWNATLYQPNQLRLHQSALSTHALTALLSIMSICIATTFLMQTKEVLPKNPRSIAAVASLLAGSKMLELWPECLDEGFSMGHWRDESIGADQAEANGDGDEGAENGATEERAVSERADSETDGQDTNVSELAEPDFTDGDGAGDENAETEQDSREGIENELTIDEAGNLNVEVTQEDDRGEEAAMMEAGKANLRFGIDIGTPDEI